MGRTDSVLLGEGLCTKIWDHRSIGWRKRLERTNKTERTLTSNEWGGCISFVSTTVIFMYLLCSFNSSCSQFNQRALPPTFPLLDIHGISNLAVRAFYSSPTSVPLSKAMGSISFQACGFAIEDSKKRVGRLEQRCASGRDRVVESESPLPNIISVWITIWVGI